MLNFQNVSSETPDKVEVAKARQELELTVSHGVRSYKDPTPSPSRHPPQCSRTSGDLAMEPLEWTVSPSRRNFVQATTTVSDRLPHRLHPWGTDTSIFSDQCEYKDPDMRELRTSNAYENGVQGLISMREEYPRQRS